MEGLLHRPQTAAPLGCAGNLANAVARPGPAPQPPRVPRGLADLRLPVLFGCHKAGCAETLPSSVIPSAVHGVNWTVYTARVIEVTYAVRTVLSRRHCVHIVMHAWLSQSLAAAACECRGLLDRARDP